MRSVPGRKFYFRFIGKKPNSKIERRYDVIIGEHFEKDHLTKKYCDSLSGLGAELTILALNKPELFNVKTISIKKKELDHAIL